MKLSYNWIKRYWNMGDITPEQYAARLNESGLTIEKTTYLKAADGKVSADNIIWDIDIPDYRNDLLCMMWTAKESCGLFHKLYTEACLYGKVGPDYSWRDKEIPERHNLYLSLTLHSSTDKCRLLHGRIINSVNGKAVSPCLITDEVYALGYEPSHIFEDIALYCGRNLGQPVYILDASKIPSREICACQAWQEGFLTYHKQRFYYQPGDLVFTSEGRVIGLCGIFFDDSVTAGKDSDSILILSGVLDRFTVRQTMKRIGLETFNGILASYGSNAGSVTKTVGNVTSYLYEYADASEMEGATLLTLMDTQRRYLKVSAKEINAILDSDFTYDEIEDVLRCGELLAFSPDEEKNSFFIKLPSYHMDEYACDIAQMLLNYVGCETVLSI